MKRARAFSLTELLVVLVIIAIVAAILFPVLAHAKKSARAATCLSNMHMIGLSSLQYAGDNDDMYPFSVIGNNRWLSRIGLATRRPDLVNVPTIVCPDLAPQQGLQPYSGYAFNGCSEDKTPPNPSRIVLSCEFAFFYPVGKPERAISMDGTAFPDFYYHDLTRWLDDMNGGHYEPVGEWGSLRHSGMGTYVFFDGHAKRFEPTAFRLPASGKPCDPASQWIGPENGPAFNPAATR